MSEKPQWYMMDSLFDTRSKNLVKTSHGKIGYIRGRIEDHYVFRVDFSDDTYHPDIIESIYKSLLEAAISMGIDREKVAIFPANIDVCRLVPCDESMHEKLEEFAEEQRRLMDTPLDTEEKN